MWLYDQSTGELCRQNDPDPASHVGFGYAGVGHGKNNPAMQNIHEVGPLPCGRYKIESPRDTPKHGPFVLPLTPDPRNKMFGRSAFLIHGDSASHPGMASNGCLVLSREIRERIWASNDFALEVAGGGSEHYDNPA